MTEGLVTGAAAFVIFALAHLAGPRISPKASRGVLALWLPPVLALAAAALLVALWLKRGGSSGQLAEMLLCAELGFFGLIVLYLPLVYTITHSLSVATLILLDAAPEGCLGEAGLARHFTSDEFARARLEAMTASGYLTSTGGRYRPTARGAALAQTFRWLKALWKLGPGG